MLKLKRLELSGFKSFVDPVGIDVAGGLTAIVGPNGCGKSNIADAVVWVLGERSAKSLRGQTMEDVIFAGAKTRRALGMAEVVLELTTENGFPQADDGKLSIGRRVFRGGESEYLVNGKTVRLKDVRDLLMDTGLGFRAYSMIEQGKIGMILSGKPLERRRLLEEAAGITRYRDRRRLAEIKLEEARGNLDRLDDILSEVERSLRSLKRQAGAARRYRKREKAYRDLLRRVLEGRWAGLQERLAGFRRQLEELQTREAERAAALHRSEAELAEGRELLDRRSRELGERHQRHAELAATVEGKQEFLKATRQRIEELGERLAAAGAAADEGEQRVATLGAALEEAAARHSELEAERRQAASELSEDEARISEVEALVGEAEDRLEGLRARLLGSINDLSGLRSRLHREQLESEKGGLRDRHLAEELERRRDDLEKTAAAAEQATAEVARLEEETLAAEQRLAADREQREGLVARQAEHAAAREAVAEQLAALRNRRALLAELGERHAERRQAVQTALAEAGFAAPEFLADRLRVPDGWEASLDLFLGGLAEAVVVPDGGDPLPLLRALAAGHATGRLIRPGATASTALGDPAIRATLGEATGLPGELAASLPPAYLVESTTDALRLARRHPGVGFITRDRLWAEGGTVHVQGAAAAPGPLARAAEREAVEARLPVAEEELAGITGELAALAEELRRSGAALAEQERRLAEQASELAVARARREDLEGRRRRLEIECRTLATERQETGRELTRIAALLADLTAELSRRETTHDELEAAFDAAQAEVDGARAERETSRTSGASRRGRLELAEARLEGHRRETERLERERREAEEAIARHRQEAAELDERRRRLREACGTAEQELQAALEERARCEEQILAAQERVDEQRDKLRGLEEEVEAGRARRDEVRAEIGEARVGEAGLKQDAEHLAESFHAHFSEAPPAEPGAPPAEVAELAADLERLKEKLDHLGPVNLLAAQEYEEQSDRHAFLSEQRADVAGSVDRLRRTIREINETSSSRFLETFRQVNAHFADTFVELFRGGGAEMRLLDEEDVLECGIEIVARPPGKRLQNIMLLSGGEKALTAIALLFALFLTKPSPFCILDEVDAPLDDLNTLRFVELLRRMSARTQFVVITHNKLTMEAASLLYGVTMQERGVSKVVAVELDAVQPAAATA